MTEPLPLALLAVFALTATALLLILARAGADDAPADDEWRDEEPGG